MGASPHTPIKITHCKLFDFFLISEIMIPDHNTLMLPVLMACSKGIVSTKEVIPDLANQFGLSEEERTRIFTNGRQSIFSNRIDWAKTFLKQAGLVEYPMRGKFTITEAGEKLLQSNPKHIDRKVLKQFKPFQDYLARNRKQSSQTDSETADDAEIETDNTTPDEKLRLAHETIKTTLADDLLDRVRNAPPQFFEKLIVDLLIAMKYGGTVSDAGRRLGGSGDGGVDGVIDQDPLGVDQVYIQAKRYDEGNNIGSGAIRDFFGSLDLKKAQKGIFFTTSEFSKSAQETANNLGTRIVLIDGKRLSNLMIDYNIGCREEEIIKLKKIDEDFFEPE